MKRRQLFLTVSGIGLWIILAASPAAAHHPFAVEYDANKPVRVHGVVTKLELVRPHSWIQIAVQKADGKVEEWTIETASADALVNRGFTKDFLRPGIEITVDGYQSKSGALRAHGRELTLANGQMLFLGTLGSGAPYDNASVPQDDQKVVRTQVAGAWWTDAGLTQRLGLTEDQKTRLQRVFENHRLAIISTTDLLEKEEAQLTRLLEAETLDRNAMFTQIDRVIQARSEMERANAAMMFEMRQQLTRAQWLQLPRTNLTIVAPGGRGGRSPNPAATPNSTPPTVGPPGQRRDGQ